MNNKDVFICHAKEDKLRVVTPLYEALKKSNISCWYDEVEIHWGDSITRKINQGLASSRYVIVVISQSFNKNQLELQLNAVLNMESHSGEGKILPLLVGEESMLQAFPLLRDRVYLPWNGNPISIVESLKKKLQNNGSSPNTENRTPFKINFSILPDHAKFESHQTNVMSFLNEANGDPVVTPINTTSLTQDNSNLTIKNFFGTTDLNNDPTKWMFEDLIQATHLIFIGRSNSTLLSYFERAIKEKEHLPFEDIDIYYRDCFKEKEKNLQYEAFLSIEQISSFFTSPDNQRFFPYLKTVNFYKMEPLYYGGAQFRIVREQKDYSVKYIRFYMQTPSKEERDFYITRVTSLADKNTTAGKLFEAYQKSLVTLQNKEFRQELHSIPLKNFAANIWDYSIDEWYNFQDKFGIYTNIMNDIWNFGKLRPNHVILDLGCSTGQTSKVIAHKLNHGRLVLVDKSPQMIKKAKQVLAKYSERITCVVADATKPLYIEAFNETFDRIIMNCSYHTIVKQATAQATTEEHIIRLLNTYLKQNGILSIVIHNSFIQSESLLNQIKKLLDQISKNPKEMPKYRGKLPTTEVSIFNPETDELRKEILQDALVNYSSLGTENILTKKNNISFSIEDIIRDFEAGGFKAEAPLILEYQRKVADRLAMWKVPAIMNSLLNIEKIGIDACCEIIDRIKTKITQMRNVPTLAVFLNFRKNKE